MYEQHAEAQYVAALLVAGQVPLRGWVHNDYQAS